MLPSDPEEEDLPACESLHDLQLPEPLLRGLSARGFERPLAAQQRAVRAIADGRDVVVRARAGSGKTVALLLGVLQRIDHGRRACQVLVLAPTREVAQRTSQEAAALGEHLGLCAHACVGILDRRADTERLAAGPHLVVGTPGRVLGALQRRELRVREVRTVAIDEADEVLARGFEDQVMEVLMRLPAEAQGCLLSATMPAEALELTARFMEHPVRISVKLDEPTLSGVPQYYVAVEGEGRKLDVICELYQRLTPTQAIIYVSTGRALATLAHELPARGLTVSVIPAECRSEHLSAALHHFLSGSSRLLLSMDVPGRSLDVPQVSLVLNYDTPLRVEDYFWRVGRGGRAHRSSVVITLVNSLEEGQLRAIERLYGTQIGALPADIADLL